MTLSPDALAILMLCSQVGLPAQPDPAPLTLREWNPLARRIQASSLNRPGALLGRSAADLKTALHMTQADAERLTRLLERGGALAIELERLASLGIWVVTRADEDYPPRLRQRLKESAPAVLFGSGEKTLLGQPGLAVVGSRHVDEAGKVFAGWIGSACTQSELAVYSGAARGVDAIAMGAALEAQGTAVGVLADSLERAIRAADARSALARGDLGLITPYAPDAGFSVGAAMGRNRLIYALADYALVIASDAEKGGTWAGAIEALKADWAPVFILSGPDTPAGNRLLLQRGGLPFPSSFVDQSSNLREWLAAHAIRGPSLPAQATLF
jgi:predicted Rossmann fold nucleotide-binding protein DprA/Smf involved in DNA uptake